MNLTTEQAALIAEATNAPADWIRAEVRTLPTRGINTRYADGGRWLSSWGDLVHAEDIQDWLHEQKLPDRPALAKPAPRDGKRLDSAFKGHVLQALREAKGWSRADVEWMIEASRGSVHSWETGYFRPNAANAALLAQLFEVELSELVASHA